MPSQDCPLTSILSSLLKPEHIPVLSPRAPQGERRKSEVLFRKIEKKQRAGRFDSLSPPGRRLG
ncbi:hypothetical protein GCM10027066_35120 [Dyella jejuensis]